MSGSLGWKTIESVIAPLSWSYGSIRQVRPPSVLRYTPDMSLLQNMRSGSYGLLTGQKIPPPPPRPRLTHSFCAAWAVVARMERMRLATASPSIRRICMFRLLYRKSTCMEGNAAEWPSRQRSGVCEVPSVTCSTSQSPNT